MKNILMDVPVAIHLYGLKLKNERKSNIMKYVKTFKASLSPSNYSPDILTTISGQHNLRAFHQQYPAPVSFKLPATNVITDKQLQVLALWYLQGTNLLYHRNFNPALPILTITNPHPKARWAYEFVTNLPGHYIKANATTTQKAYEYGQRLIAAVTKANNIPFSTIEAAYKAIARPLLQTSPRLKIYSPNAKTLLEVRAELQAAKELADLSQFLTENSGESELLINLYNEYELNLYSRIFDIEMPEWSLKYKMVPTKHGYAQLPELHMSTPSTISIANTDYAGAEDGFNDQLNRIPYTLRRDSLPTSIHKQNLTVELAQSISWYLKTFKETRDEELLSPNWGYCEHCGFYQRSEGCQCGAIPSLEELELDTIYDTYDAIEDGSYYKRLEV